MFNPENQVRVPVGATWYAGLMAETHGKSCDLCGWGHVVVMISASDLVDGNANRRKARPRYGWQGLEGHWLFIVGAMAFNGRLLLELFCRCAARARHFR